MHISKCFPVLTCIGWHVEVCVGVAPGVVILSAHLERGGDMFHFLCNRISISLSQGVRGHPVEQVGWVIAVTLPSTAAGQWCNWWTAAAQCCLYLADWWMASFSHKDAHKTDLFFEIATMGNMSCVKWRICFYDWISVPDVLLSCSLTRQTNSSGRVARCIAVSTLCIKINYLCSIITITDQKDYVNHPSTSQQHKHTALAYCSAREETSHRAVQLDFATES